MGLGEKLQRLRGAGIPWAQKTGIQRFFFIAGPITYIGWGLILIFATVIAAILGSAFDQGKRH